MIMYEDIIAQAIVSGVVTWAIPYGLQRSLEYYKKNI